MRFLFAAAIAALTILASSAPRAQMTLDKTFTNFVSTAPQSTVPLGVGDLIPVIQGGKTTRASAAAINITLPPIPSNTLFGNTTANPAIPTSVAVNSPLGFNGGALALSVGGALSVVNNQLTIAGGAIAAPLLAAGAASSNIGALGGDVTGTLPTVTVGKLQGNAVATTAPGNGQVLTWSSSAGQWQPSAPSTGITQLTGAINAGPGSGSQSALITPTGVAAGSYTLGSDCLSVNAGGQVTSITAGACNGGATYVLIDAGGHITLNAGGSLLDNGT